MKIGILGTGHIGKTLVKQLSAAGHDVKVANSRGPETIEADLLSGGAQAVTTQEAVRDVEVVILSIPLNRIPLNRIPQIAPLITCCIPCVVRPRAFALAARPLHHPDQRAAGHAGPRLSRDPARSGLNSFLLNARTAVRAAS